MAAAVKSGRKRRYALLAGVAVAVLAFVILRRSGSSGIPLVPATGTADGLIDAGGSADSNLLPAINDLTSFTALLESQIAGMQSTSESLSQQVGNVAGQLATLLTPPAPPPAAPPPPAAAPAPVTVPGASGQQPAASPGNAAVSAAVFTGPTVFPRSSPATNPIPGAPLRAV